MNNYLIYYITTGIYVQNAYEFFETLNLFMPNDNLDVIWLSDNFVDVKQYPNINIIKKHIYDMPWPLVCELKLHYIYENKLCAYDGYFYFNANSKFIEMKQSTIDDIKYALENNYVICTNHTCGPEPEPQLEDINYDSYAQACFFGANYNIFFTLIERAVNKMNEYLLNATLPEFQDETCFLYALNELKLKRWQKSYGVNIDINDKYKIMLEKHDNIFIILYQKHKKQKKYKSLNNKCLYLV